MADIGDGASVSFGTSNFAGNFKTLQHTGVSRASVDTTYLGTATAKTFMPGDLYDPGELAGTISYDPDEQPPFNGAVETITVSFPVASGNSNAATMACSGFVTNFDEPELVNDTEMIASITCKLTGTITWVDGS